MVQKIGILAADTVLIPIIIGRMAPDAAANQAISPNQDVRQVFLVHLQVRKMPVAVTVYASKEAAGEESPKVVDSENEKMDEADDSNAAISNNSDELGDEEIEEFMLA